MNKIEIFFGTAAVAAGMLFLCGCTLTGATEAESSAIVEVEEEKITVKADLNDFAKRWTELTKVRQELVIYHPCDAANRNVNFYLNNEGKWYFSVEEGHETEEFEVLDFVKQTTGFVISGIDNYSKNLVTFFITDQDNDLHTARWSWKSNGTDFNAIMVNEAGEAAVKVVTQPCRECWDEEVCSDE